MFERFKLAAVRCAAQRSLSYRHPSAKVLVEASNQSGSRTPTRLWALIFLLLFGVLALCTPALAQSSGDEQYVKGEFIVKFAPSAVAEIRNEIPALKSYSDEQVEELLVETMEGVVTEELPLADTSTVVADNGEELDAAAAVDLLDARLIEYIEPNFIYRANAVPNDPLYGNLWGLHQANDIDIDAPEAWDITTGNTDEPVVVAVIDTGVDYLHPDLAANMWVNTAEKNGTTGVDDDGNGVVDDIYGYNAITLGGDPMDDQANTYHGTHCAGTIGAVGNNNVGITGVAWNVKIMAIKFLSSTGNGTTTDAIRSVNYAVMMKNRGVNLRVLSNSWGGGGYSASLNSAIEAANDAGMIFIAAAGNSNTNNDVSPHYPSNYSVENVVSVAAIDQNGSKASFSNYGATTVDLAAPGVSIYSTKRGSSYQYLSGTSMATPHVSGVAALVIGRFPQYTPAELKTALMDTVQPVAGLNGLMVSPGIVNAKNVLADPDNFPPTLAAIDDQSISPITREKVVPISVSDPEGDPITYQAEILVPDDVAAAAALDETYGLTTYLSYNFYGLGEKLYRGVDNRIFFTLSTGGFFELVGNYYYYRGDVSTYYYTNHLALLDAYPIDTSDFGTLQFQNNNQELKITTAQGFEGTFGVKVTVSDGNRSHSRTFQVSVINAAPQIVAIPDQSMPHTQDKLLVPVTASDPDGEAVTLSASFVGLNPGAVLSFAGTTLTVDPPAGYVGQFTVRVLASDGVHAASEDFKVTVTNHAPVLAAIGSRQMSKGEDSLTIELSATDPDGDPLSFSAQLNDFPALAYQLDQTYKLYLSNSYYQNYNGMQEKLIRSDTGLLVWFYILPNGALYRLGSADTPVEQAQFIATLSPAYYDNPSLLHDAAPVAGGATNVVLTLTGTSLKIDPPQGFTGSFSVYIEVTDGAYRDSEEFIVNVNNQAPVLAPIGSRSIGSDHQPLNIALSATDADQDLLSYQATIYGPESTAYQIDQQWKLFADASYYLNYNGLAEKYIRSALSPVLWFIILPSGDVYRLDQGPQAVNQRTYVSRLPHAYYQTPALLHDAPEPSAGNAPAVVSLSGSTLSIAPRADFAGDFEIDVVVSDGSLEDSERITISVAAAASGDGSQAVLDSDGDGLSDDEETAAGTDPFDAGSFKKTLDGPIYTVWNSFLRMINILELVNPEDYDKVITVTLYAIDGEVLNVIPVLVPARSQFDLIVNDIPGFEIDSYGLLKLDFDGVIDGRMFYYRAEGASGEYEFAFGVPLANASNGQTSVAFNTFNPSQNALEVSNEVPNWLTVVNLADSGKAFNIYSYAADGTLLLERSIGIAGKARMDIDGGHGFAGSSAVGLHVIVPADPEAPYLAQLIRYGGNAAPGAVPTKYSFAFPLSAKAGLGRRMHVPISKQFGEDNWVEVVNTLGLSVNVVVEYFASTGERRAVEQLQLPAYAQAHRYASQYLQPGESGVAIITPSAGNSVITGSMFYFRDAASGSINAMFGSQGVEVLGRILFGSYNRFLNINNWLRIANNSDAPAQVQVTVNSAAGSVEEVIDLAANGSAVLPLHDGARFRTVPESYGTVEVRISEGAAVFSELIRERPGANGLDFAAPTTVR